MARNKVNLDSVNYSRPPTCEEILIRHNHAKGWYESRNQFLFDFLDMFMLESPFGEDKKAVEDGAYLLPSGKVVFSVASFPADIATLITSALEKKYPYVNARPTSKKHTDKVLQEYEMFAQGCIDMFMNEQAFLDKAAMLLIVTGWNIFYFPFDQRLKDKGKFPIKLELLNPLGCYPMLDSNLQPIYMTFERVVTGAQLLKDYLIYPGVAELFEAEAEDSAIYADDVKHRSEKNNSLLTCEFTVTRYVDDEVTCLLINGSSASQMACKYNRKLETMKRRNLANKPYSLLHAADGDNDPYLGVEYHKLGRIPVHIEGCWLEPYDQEPQTRSSVRGKLVYLPFLFSLRRKWEDISRIQSMLHTSLLRTSTPQIVTDSQTADTDLQVIQVEPGEKVQPLEYPPLTPEANNLMRILMEEVDRSSVAPVAYGMTAGTSGLQDNQARESGAVRMDKIASKFGRGLNGTITAIAQILKYRGDDDVPYNGLGGKTGKAYAETIDLSVIPDDLPTTQVDLLRTNAYDDPQNVAKYKSLREAGMPESYLLRVVMSEPNPERIIEMAKQEAAAKETKALTPYVELAILKAQIETIEEKIKLQATLDEITQKAQLAQQERQLKAQIRALPKELELAELKNQIDTAMQLLNPMPPAPPPMPGMMPPPDMGGMPPPGMMPPSPPPPMPPGIMPPSPQGTAPGQATAPLQPLGRDSGISATGVPSMLVGGNGIMASNTPPEIAAANLATATVPDLQIAGAGTNYRNVPRRRPKRGN